MDIPVLLEPTPTGWRASTGGPFNLVTEGPDKESVLAELRRQIVMKYVSGTRVVSLTVPEPHPSLEIAARMAKNPFMEEWDQAIRENRAEAAAREAAGEEGVVPESPTAADRNGLVPHTADTVEPSRP
jgi:hypothetical protein